MDIYIYDGYIYIYIDHIFILMMVIFMDHPFPLQILHTRGDKPRFLGVLNMNGGWEYIILYIGV